METNESYEGINPNQNWILYKQECILQVEKLARLCVFGFSGVEEYIQQQQFYMSQPNALSQLKINNLQLFIYELKNLIQIFSNNLPQSEEYLKDIEFLSKVTEENPLYTFVEDEFKDFQHLQLTPLFFKAQEDALKIKNEVIAELTPFLDQSEESHKEKRLK